MMQHYVFRSLWAGFKFWERQIGDSLRPQFYSDRPCMNCVTLHMNICDSKGSCWGQDALVPNLGSLRCYYPGYWGRMSLAGYYAFSSSIYSGCPKEVWCWWGINLLGKATNATYAITITGGDPGLTGRRILIDIVGGCDVSLNCKDTFDKYYPDRISRRAICTNYAKCCNPPGGNICNGCPSL